MSEAAELIEQVHAAGGRVLAVGDRLRLQAPPPLPDDLIEALRAHKADVLREIGVANSTGQGALVTLLRIPEGCPDEWCDGIVQLLSMPVPRSYSAETWAILRDDAAGFFWRWAGEAARLGWPTLAVWGVHPTKPQARTDCVGLVAILRGRAITELTAEAARVEGLRIFRRSPAREAVPLWELNDRPHE